MKRSARLRNNMSANLMGTAISALAAMISAPLIFRCLGSDAYGLVGIYILLQSMMPLFDLGITAGLARAVAWHRGKGGLGEVRTLIGMAHRPMFFLSLLFCLGLWFGSGYLAHRWLDSTLLPDSTIRLALILMGAALAVRMVAGVNRAALMAIERQVEGNFVQAGASIARTFGALGLALATGTGVIGFLAFQLPVSAAEWLCYRIVLRRFLPAQGTPVAPSDLRLHLQFSAGIAGLAALWLLTSQIDKLALSRSMPLADYGAYSLGVHIAAVIVMAVGTIHGAVLPRLTGLLAAGHEPQGRLLYGIATALTVALAAGMAVAIALGGRLIVPFLQTTASNVDPLRVAFIYALGNGAVAIMAMAYQLQNAQGRLRLHALGTVLQAAIQVPILLWVASTGDAIATAITFLILNWVFVVFWMPLVHARFLTGGHLGWLRRDLLPALAAAAVVGGLCLAGSRYVPENLLPSTVMLITGTAATIFAALIAHGDIRAYLRDHARTWMAIHGH